MQYKHAILTLLFSLLAVSAYGQTAVPVYLHEPSGEYLRDWLLCGPFPLLEEGENPDKMQLSGMFTDYLRDFGGETSPKLSDAIRKSPKGEVRWFRHVSDKDYVDLDSAVSEKGTGVAYGYCEIQAETPSLCLLAFASNDGGRVWLNGEEIVTDPGAHGLKWDMHIVPVLLKKGSNRLLVKVEERGNRWQLAARFLPWDFRLVQERARLFEVVRKDDGTPVLRLCHSPEMWRELAERVTLSASPLSGSQNEIWRAKWSGKREMPIDVPTNFYREYLLHVTYRLKGGESSMVTIPFAAGKRVEYVLFNEGKTDYAIVLSREASESEKWAAEELRHWLKEVSGADFPLASTESFSGSKAIYVGYDEFVGDKLKTLLKEQSHAPASADESFHYFNLNGDIFIYGGKDRGTMYGVMSFLEREMGVRFYTPRVTVTPRKVRYMFVALDHTEAPGIRVRNDFYYEAFDPIWAARNRVNGAMTWREQPGGLECYWSVHTFFPLMPPEEFFESHPEYYSLVNGKRQYDRAQLCLTNPDVLRIITERIKQKMRELPQYLIYDVSQNDWGNPCECESCQAIAKREESESGPVIWFVNQVADAVREEFPDKFIGTLAYQYTRKPPKTLKPRDNVVVRLCSIECCFAHDFLNCPENESFVDDMKNWAKIAPHLYIWDYVVNFSHYIMPYPNFRVLQPNIQFFRDHNAIGIMEQAAYQSRGGEFAELRAYVIAKLLWNPEADVPTIIDDFMYGYYGRAGQYVKAYFDLLHNQITPETHIHLGLTPDDKIFSDSFVRQSEALFDEAETVADNEEIRQRVEMARLPIMYLKCRRTPLLAKQDGTYDRFKAIVAREGITHYAESGVPHREAFHEMMESAGLK